MAGKRIVLCFLLCILSGLKAQNCSKDLKNTVVYEGESITFNNLNDGQPVKWQFISCTDFFNSVMDITNFDNIVKPKFKGVFSVTATQLTIIKATEARETSNGSATSGMYILTYKSSGCKTGAKLIVVRSEPVCGASDQNELTCNVTYGDSIQQPLFPNMTWMDDTGNVIHQNDQPKLMTSGNARLSVSKIPLKGLRASSNYVCQVTFGAPLKTQFAYVATNAPSFKASCTVTRAATIPPKEDNDAITASGGQPPVRPAAHTDPTPPSLDQSPPANIRVAGHTDPTDENGGQLPVTNHPKAVTGEEGRPPIPGKILEVSIPPNADTDANRPTSSHHMDPRPF